MKKLITTISTLIVLAGCTTMEDLDAGLRDLKGKPYQVAFAKLGFPDNEKTVAGHKVYVWSTSSSGSYSIPKYNTATSYVNGQAIYTNYQTTENVSYDYSCEVEVIVDPSGTIAHIKWEGNPGGCEAYAQRVKVPKKPA
ncbi:hypothetical protein [Sinorhizobium fredii]|uniref:hypothetical protein n=1 Tax=Rhizobium fredii TaxID=380 RepID=UPI003512BC03